MSVLSSPQGRPETVFALMDLLDAHGGQMPRDEVVEWMVPSIRKHDDPHRRADGEKPKGAILRVTGTIDIADSLGFVRRAGKNIELAVPMPPSIDIFADLVHARLISIPKEHPDSVIMSVFSWFVAQYDQASSKELLGMSNEELANQINNDLQDTDLRKDRIFNKEKYPAWRAWVNFMGLGSDAVWTSGGRFYPHVAKRLIRTLNPLVATEYAFRKRYDLGDVLRVIAKSMPYLDGGQIFMGVAPPINLQTYEKRQISLVLSNALLELVDDGMIELLLPGDSVVPYRLADAVTGQHRGVTQILFFDTGEWS